jgi:hypothetical protein
MEDNQYINFQNYFDKLSKLNEIIRNKNKEWIIFKNENLNEKLNRLNYISKKINKYKSIFNNLKLNIKKLSFYERSFWDIKTQDYDKNLKENILNYNWNFNLINLNSINLNHNIMIQNADENNLIKDSKKEILYNKDKDIEIIELDNDNKPIIDFESNNNNHMFNNGFILNENENLTFIENNTKRKYLFMKIISKIKKKKIELIISIFMILFIILIIIYGYSNKK